MAGTASTVRSVRGAQNGIFCHVVYLVTARDGVLAALARFIAVLFDGLVDGVAPRPEGHCDEVGSSSPTCRRALSRHRPARKYRRRQGMPEFLVRVSELAD
jgi:hypothetical protein